MKGVGTKRNRGGGVDYVERVFFRGERLWLAWKDGLNYTILATASIVQLQAETFVPTEPVL